VTKIQGGWWDEVGGGWDEVGGGWDEVGGGDVRKKVRNEKDRERR
jgi:hypothetical protein